MSHPEPLAVTSPITGDEWRVMFMQHPDGGPECVFVARTDAMCCENRAPSPDDARKAVLARLVTAASKESAGDVLALAQAVETLDRCESRSGS